MGKLRIATWNIGSILADYDHNKAVFLQTIKQDKPNILFLQECPESSSLIEELMKTGLFKDYLYLKTSPSHIQEGWNMGIAIFSVDKLFNEKSIQLTMPNEEIYYNGKQEFWHKKFFMKSSFAWSGQRFMLITGHGFPFYRYHLKEEEHLFVYQEVETFIKENVEPDEIFIVGADFNAAHSIDYMTSIKADHIDVFDGKATRPSGRKTDAVILPKESFYDNVTNISIEGYDHNYLSLDFHF